jgi:hypothetical protein
LSRPIMAMRLLNSPVAVGVFGELFACTTCKNYKWDETSSSLHPFGIARMREIPSGYDWKINLSL